VALESLPIDLGQVLEECTSLFAGSAESKGIELIVCSPVAIEGSTLLGDPLRVRQILMNLVGNAVKFTSKGEVVVRADVERTADGAIATIAVSDTGVGMDATAMQRIFEPFAQADETTTRKFGGTGLGLSICRELSDLMGGRISVASQPQIGSTFTLKLPLTIAAATEAPAPSPFAGKRVRLLSRRPSLEEALKRHATMLGLVADATEADVAVIDVGSQLEDMKAMLARSQDLSHVVAIATAAEVEAHDLRVVLDEKRIVLKPVHRIALREALAVALGIRLADSTGALPAATNARLRGHVLLVEDEAVNAAVAEGYLASLGCTSAWVTTGADAIARFAGERFDLVLMDLNMPDMDGFTATRLIRQRESKSGRIPIVALTAHEAGNYREKCLAADMDDILSKPYTYDDCTHLLRKWLSGSTAAAPETLAPTPTPETAQDPFLAIDAGTIGALRKLRADKHADLYSKLVGLFAKGSTEALAQLNEALEANDLTAAAAICHKLASSAANVGALAYGKQVRRLEQACSAGERDTVKQVSAALRTAHAPLLQALQAMTLRASA
jgi:CheY-like chemotaxis protein